MMSDSELSDAPSISTPPDATLEKEIRKQVATWTKKSGGEDLTVNKIREVTEKVLGLHPGFFNGHTAWKTKSKTIIKDAVENPEVPPSSSPAKLSSVKPPPVKALPKSRPAKRPSPTPEGPNKKRQKKSLPPLESEDELSSLPTDLSSDEGDPKPKKKPIKPRSAVTSKPPKKDAKSKPMSKSKPNPKKADSDSESSDESAEESEEKSQLVIKSKPDDDSASELSVLLDDDPKPKKRQKSKDPASKTQRSTKAAEADPDQEEIKRLQGWLVKCGIRKLWGKELKPYETTRAKIKHLKDMLSDAGMTGRYSQEKAAEIREARELAADIEAVQEGAERWGKDADQEDEDDGRSKRKLVRGVKHYDFLSSDGEETD